MIKEKDLLFVIVIYKLNLKDSVSFRSICDITAQYTSSIFNVAIYDNSPDPQMVASKYPNMSLYYNHDPTNPGISKSYNNAAKLAIKHDSKWLLFLDHDTELPIDTIEKYIFAINTKPQNEIKVPRLYLVSGNLFSPSKFKYNRSQMLKVLNAGIHPFHQMTFVNSGMLISLDLFIKAGGYNEKVKLDHSDTEFVKRIRKVTKHFELLNINLLHDFSNDLTDLQKAKSRFESYVIDTKNCTRSNFWDFITISLNCFIRTGSLTLKYRKLTFMGIFIRKYLF